MTTVYFVRHAQSDASVQDPFLRPLTEQGLRDRFKTIQTSWYYD